MRPTMLLQDLRHGWRSLRRAPGLTFISILTVALGVGAGTALFSVVKAVLLNPLPYPQPDRLTWVEAIMGGGPVRVSMPDFDDWRSQNRGFAALAAYSDSPILVGGGETPELTSGVIVTEDFFDVLGVRPAMGRLFSADEHRPGQPLATAVIGHGLWQRAFGGDPNIVGRTITLVGFRSTVIGVMPPGFAFPAGTDLWVSARAVNEGISRSAHNYWVIGRLRDGVAVETADRDISAIATRLNQQYPGPFQTTDATARPLALHLVGSARTPLLLLFGAVGLLLLIVCVNVANLLLVRTSARSRELALRAAVGAERRDLIRQLLVESLMLAAAGGALGLLITFWSMDLIRLMLPVTLPRAADVGIDAGVMMFAAAVSLGAGVLFGTLPAWRASLLNVHDVLKAGGRGQTPSPRSRRVQAALIVSEVALSLVLLAGAGLLLESFARLRAVDPGFVSQGVLTMSMSFPVGRAEVPRLAARYRDLLARVRALPGVELAGTIKDLPLNPIQRSGHFFIETRRDAPVSEAGFLVVTPGVMEALRIPLVRGRYLTEADAEEAPGVVVISAEMARRFWPDRDPIGERIWFNSFEPKEHWLTIVGVAGDVRQSGLTEPARAQAYISYAQVQIKANLGVGNLIVRSSLDPGSVIAPVRQALREVHPGAAASFRTLDDLMAAATARQRFQTQVLGAFAALALVLAAIGLYGVLSYTVTSGRAAIAVRLALGARPRDVFRLVAARGLALTVIGAALGIAGVVALSSVLERVVFGVGPSDPAILGVAACVMLTTALAACWFPARRAMRVDPVTALRDE